MAKKKTTSSAPTSAQSNTEEAPAVVRRQGDGSRMLSREELEEIHGKEALDENERKAHEQRSRRS